MENVEQEVLQFLALKQKGKVVVMLHCVAHYRFSFFYRKQNRIKGE